jgi:hypothetical protein
MRALLILLLSANLAAAGETNPPAFLFRQGARTIRPAGSGYRPHMPDGTTLCVEKSGRGYLMRKDGATVRVARTPGGWMACDWRPRAGQS